MDDLAFVHRFPANARSVVGATEIEKIDDETFVDALQELNDRFSAVPPAQREEMVTGNKLMVLCRHNASLEEIRTQMGERMVSFLSKRSVDFFIFCVTGVSPELLRRWLRPLRKTHTKLEVEHVVDFVGEFVRHMNADAHVMSSVYPGLLEMQTTLVRNQSAVAARASVAHACFLGCVPLATRVVVAAAPLFGVSVPTPKRMMVRTPLSLQHEELSWIISMFPLWVEPTRCGAFDVFRAHTFANTNLHQCVSLYLPGWYERGAHVPFRTKQVMQLKKMQMQQKWTFTKNDVQAIILETLRSGDRGCSFVAVHEDEPPIAAEEPSEPHPPPFPALRPVLHLP